MATEEIGTSIDLTKGNYNNVKLENGNLTLDVKKVFDNQDIHYVDGYYESEVMNLQGSISDFQNIASSITVPEDGSYEILTRSSEDNETWSDYEKISEDGSIISPVGFYVQVKVNFYAGFENIERTGINFTSEDESVFEDNKYIGFDNKMYIKTQTDEPMEYDDSWSDTGHVFRKTINKSELKQLNSIRNNIIND